MPGIVEGDVKSVKQGVFVLAPRNTSYELHLASDAAVAADAKVRGMVSLKARKVWTIAAGGGFIQPLFGEPRVVQGMVKALEGNRIVVQAGVAVNVELPAEKTAMDLKNGELRPGVMVNVTIFPGAKFELIRE